MSSSGCKQLIFRLNDHGQGPELLRHVFLERGWQEFDEDEQDEQDWNLWWRSSRFRNSDYEQLQGWQRLNHHPKCTAITKKDALARNMKRMKAVHGASVYNFSPMAFNLPNDYTKFVGHCSKLKEKDPHRQLTWICKPADLSRGRGIFLFKDLSELQYDCNAVVQQYICNPLLISGYKFDLRIYVLVPSFHPLVVYIYDEGLVRFGTDKFDLGDIGNMFSHLTNTSINKHSPNYVVDKERVGPGCKWTLAQLRSYLRQINVDDRLVFSRIVNVVLLTLFTQVDLAPKSYNCFELYGFDVMVDENLKPWLLEVNFSPSLNSDCQVDLMVKKPMLHDLIDILQFTEQDKQLGDNQPAHLTRNTGRIIPPRYNIFDSSCRPYPLSLARKRSKLPEITASVRVPESEVEDKEDGVVPIVPGCGLPSVQQQPPHHHPASDSSDRSSPCSELSNSSTDQPRQQRTSTRHTLPRSLPISMCGKNSLPPSSRVFNPSFCGSGNRPHPKLKKLQQPHVHYDSTVSSRSSDSLDATENVPPRKKLYAGYPLKVASAPDRLKKDFHGSKPSSIRSESPADSTPVLMRRKLPSESCIDEAEKRRKNKKKKLPHWSANPLNKRSSLNQMSSKPLSYVKPWERPRPYVRNPGPPKASQVHSSRVGDFFLAFPFNDVTRKYSEGKLDVKTVIQECHKQLKEQINGSSCQKEGPPRRVLWPMFGDVTR